MRKFLFAALTLIAAQCVNAQSTQVTGSVKNTKGDPIHFAFVVDAQYKNTAFTDSLGNFSIPVSPDSKLRVRLLGYADTTVNASANLQIVLRQIFAGSSVNASTPTAQNLANDAIVSASYGGEMMPGHQKGNTHGSQFVFNNFVHGYFIDMAGNISYRPDYLYDYNKMDGGLLITRDGRNIGLLGQTKGFTLFSDHDERLDFEKVPSIDAAHFVQVLASGKKYNIYKLTKTRFVKADYVNNGVTSHGNDYDEYIDDVDYYVVDAQSNQQQKISLKKKSLKEGFSKEADKATKYIADNGGSIDEAYLSKMGAYMNQ